MHDVNFWKTFLAARLKAIGPSALAVYGNDVRAHRMLADHFKAEYCEKTEGHGRVVLDWSLLPGQDNHLLDGAVGCFAAAALQGCRLAENQPKDAGKAKSRIPDHLVVGRAR